MWVSSIKMFRVFNIINNIINNVPLLSELQTSHGKTSFDLTEESNTEDVLDVLREERKEYVEMCENKVQTKIQEETKVQVDKSVDVDLDTSDIEVRDLNIQFLILTFYFQSKDIEAMDCEAAPNVGESETVTEPAKPVENVQKDSVSKPAVTSNSPECNKDM